jgi:hypothetical protein
MLLREPVFKETAVGLILVIILFTGLVALRNQSASERLYFMVRCLSPFAILIALYFAARLTAGGLLQGEGRYQLGMEMNVVNNLMVFGLASIDPISSVT